MNVRQLSLVGVTSLLIACSVPPTNAYAQGDDIPNFLKLIRDIQRSQEREAQQLAEAAQLSLVAEALRLAELEKKAAQSELSQLEFKRAELRHQIKVQDWALRSFEPGLRGVLPADKVSSQMKRLQDARSIFRRQLLSTPDEVRGAIKSGRALNFFLETCGGVAQTHEASRRHLEDRLRETDLPSTERMELQKQLSILDTVAGTESLTEEQRKRIRYQIGLTGAKLILDAEDGPLPLRWPALLDRLQEFRPHLDQLASARDAALASLAKGERITPDIQRELLGASDNLARKFRELPVPTDGAELLQWISAKRFIDGTRYGVCRLLEARRLSDVQPTEPFRGTRIDQLLAYMSRNGYRFAEAESSSEAAYQAIYGQLVDYYTQLHCLHLATRRDIRDEAELASRANQLFPVAHRNTMADLQMALNALPSRRSFPEVLVVTSDVIEAIAAMGHTERSTQALEDGNIRSSRDQILLKLGEARGLRAAGLGEVEIAGRLGISLEQYRAWREQYEEK